VPITASDKKPESQVAAKRIRLWIERLRTFALTPHVIPVACVTLVFAALYSIMGIVEHRAYRTALFDLGIYDQALQGYARFGLPRVPIFGLRDVDHLGPVHWSDHFTPILALLTPFYWIHRGPETLLVAEGVLFALAVPFVWIFARRAIGVVPAYAIAIAFGLSWPVQAAVSFPFHQVAFAVPLMAIMLERFQAGQTRHAVVACLCLLGVREDLGLVVSTFGFLLLLKGERRLGLGLMVGGVFATWLLTSVVIPVVGGSPRRNWTFWHFGSNPLELLFALLKSPLESVEYALSPATKVRTLLWLLAPTFFLAVRSRLFLLALPLLIVRFLSSEEHHWSLEYHYNAFVVVTIWCAAIDAASRLPRFDLGRRLRGLSGAKAWGLAVLVLTLWTLPRWPGWRMTERAFWYPRTPKVKAAEMAAASIPDGVLVASANTVGAHLTRRTKVVLLVPAGNRYEVEAVWELQGISWKYLGDRKRATAPWVLADVSTQQFPFESVAQQQAQVNELEKAGYVVVYRNEHYVVLNRPAATVPAVPGNP
jgi:uncharacterized membrane protein